MQVFVTWPREVRNSVWRPQQVSLWAPQRGPHHSQTPCLSGLAPPQRAESGTVSGRTRGTISSPCVLQVRQQQSETPSCTWHYLIGGTTGRRHLEASAPLDTARSWLRWSWGRRWWKATPCILMEMKQYSRRISLRDDCCLCGHLRTQQARGMFQAKCRQRGWESQRNALHEGRLCLKYFHSLTRLMLPHTPEISLR